MRQRKMLVKFFGIGDRWMHILQNYLPKSEAELESDDKPSLIEIAQQDGDYLLTRSEIELKVAEIAKTKECEAFFLLCVGCGRNIIALQTITDDRLAPSPLTWVLDHLNHSQDHILVPPRPELN